ncbi:MAG: hypothetical protein AB8G86_13690 [Saprospiraceae bacterium]
MQTFSKLFIALASLPFCFSFLWNQAYNQTLSIPFYSEQIELVYHPDIKQSFKGKLEEQTIVQYYEALEESSHESLVNALKIQKKRLALNDWLAYELTQKAVAEIFNQHAQKEKTLATWFLLSKLGYDTRLAFFKNEAFIYVRSLEDIYETPLIEDQGNKFVGLTEMQYKRTVSSKGVYLLNFLAAPNGQPFSFSLSSLPQLKSNEQQKKFDFEWKTNKYELTVQCDQTLVNIMEKYPVIGEVDYLKTPFSPILRKSLLPQIAEIIAGKTTKEALEILVSFTRSAFIYKEDEVYFGRSKPMIREEVFFYPYSDCEDRSALFYGLVESLLDLPMIIVAFPDHLTVAVALDQPIGPSIQYKGKKFYIVDPTGPSNSSEIGRIPKGYEKQSFEILMDNL